eukprot:scaffold935_cov248-Pinguiococcus_pyrenoidosus.AAC.8
MLTTLYGNSSLGFIGGFMNETTSATASAQRTVALLQVRIGLVFAAATRSDMWISTPDRHCCSDSGRPLASIPASRSTLSSWNIQFSSSTSMLKIP